jgi:hypothetical protein
MDLRAENTPRSLVLVPEGDLSAELDQLDELVDGLKEVKEGLDEAEEFGDKLDELKGRIQDARDNPESLSGEVYGQLAVDIIMIVPEQLPLPEPVQKVIENVGKAIGLLLGAAVESSLFSSRTRFRQLVESGMDLQEAAEQSAPTKQQQLYLIWVWKTGKMKALNAPRTESGWEDFKAWLRGLAGAIGLGSGGCLLLVLALGGVLLAAVGYFAATALIGSDGSPLPVVPVSTNSGDDGAGDGSEDSAGDPGDEDEDQPDDDIPPEDDEPDEPDDASDDPPDSTADDEADDTGDQATGDDGGQSTGGGDEPATDGTDSPGDDGPIPAGDDEPSGDGQLQSGAYNGTVTTIRNPHTGVINPDGLNVIVYRYLGADSGLPYYELLNVFGGYASNLVLRGGPFEPDGAFDLVGTADFLDGAYPGVPVRATGTLVDREVSMNVRIGPGDLPFAEDAEWHYTLRYAGELPTTAPSPPAQSAPIVVTTIVITQVVSALTGNCGAGVHVGDDFSPDAPSDLTVDWRNRTVNLGDSLPSPFDPFTGDTIISWADGRETAGRLGRTGLTGTSHFNPFSGCSVDFTTTGAADADLYSTFP